MIEIKPYIAAQLKKVQTSLREWDGDGTYKDVGGNKLNDTYTLSYGEIDSSFNGSISTDTIPVEVVVSKMKKIINGTSNIHQLVDLGMQMRSEIAGVKNYRETMIANIVPVKMSVRPSSDNPDIFEIYLNFTFEINQTL